ncbi:hypothetical protein BXP70_26500 [Hymenobacter crusticola]|uniref:Uncharacterized protein n=1 Tax=Hymenobacter crusticola TaxID=1770526 RepID=A0A243W6E2_9BACT|nr:hypothetical protein BXP70_26500 [Hymenobacter crusticola]
MLLLVSAWRARSFQFDEKSLLKLDLDVGALPSQVLNRPFKASSWRKHGNILYQRISSSLQFTIDKVYHILLLAAFKI